MEAVPRAEDVTLNPIEEDYKKVILIQWSIFWLVTAGIATTLICLIRSWQHLYVIIPVAFFLTCFAIFHLIILRKSARYKAYAIREHDVIYRTGWLVRSVKVVPFNRIQHCSVDEGMIARRYRLSSIRLFTSGSNDADVRIPGLKASFAADLRELIIAKTRDHGGAI